MTTLYIYYSYGHYCQVMCMDFHYLLKLDDHGPLGRGEERNKETNMQASL